MIDKTIGVTLNGQTVKLVLPHITHRCHLDFAKQPVELTSLSLSLLLLKHIQKQKTNCRRRSVTEEENF